MKDFEYITEIDSLSKDYESNIRKLAYTKDKMPSVSSIKKSSYVKSVTSKDDTYIIELNKSKKVACGISTKIAYDLKLANPSFDICLDEDLLNMEEDENLVFKSKNPLWVLHNAGNVLVLKRLF